MDAIDSELHDFIGSNIDSVESVEVLLLLRRSPDTFWSASAIADQLSLRPELVASKLHRLHGRRLIKVGDRTGAYRFSPGDERLSRCLERLAEAWTDLRSAVVAILRTEPRPPGDEQRLNEPR